MVTPTRQPHNLVSLGGEPARRITGGDVVLDALTVPYGVATAVYDLTAGDADDADPRDDTRALLTCSADGGATVRLFDLGVRERIIDHTAKTVELTLATDEALAMDYATLASDSGARTHQTSLRAICNYVLGKIGASLASGGPDADMTATWPVENVLRNPRAAVDTSLWATASSLATLSRAATGGPDGGSRFISTSASGAGGVGIIYSPAGASAPAINETELRVKPGQVVRFAAEVVKGSASGNTLQLRVRFSNGTSYREVLGPVVTPQQGVWSRFDMSVVVPAGMTSVTPWLGGAVGSSWPVGAALSISKLICTIGESELVPYFDGSTPADAFYTYSWDDVANSSISRRTPIDSRPPEMFTWAPGVTAWDFLVPFTTAAGLRLFCDETRVWRLINPSSYLLPGFVRVTAANATEGVDTTTRRDPEIFATGVVVKYSWTDLNGIPQTAYDSAGTPNKVFVIEYERPYPGPGAAAAILARRDGTGRVQAVTGLIDWDATPSMTASVTMPFTSEQQGKVSSVAFNLGDDATMQVGTAGLIEIPPGSIDALDGTIDALVGAIDNLNPIARRP